MSKVIKGATRSQQRAADKIADWIRSGRRGPILITGPRRSGRTWLAARLVEAFDGRIDGVILSTRGIAPIPICDERLTLVVASPPASRSEDWIAYYANDPRALTVRLNGVGVPGSAAEDLVASLQAHLAKAQQNGEDL